MLKLLYLSFFLIFLMTKTAIPQSNVYIFANINEEIITNIDIEKEIKYLRFLNKNMNQLSDKKIKKNEIKKFIDLKKDNTFVDEYLKNIYLKLNYNNKDEFKKAILEQNNYSYNEIKEKINIELFWNELIYNKFKNQLKINE